jgi:tetratricopeptide (TPR) repeat protein
MSNRGANRHKSVWNRVKISHTAGHIHRLPVELFQALVRLGKSGIMRSPRAYFDEGNACYNQKDYTAAIVAYTRAIQRDPRFLGAHVNLGNAYTALHRYEEALAEYDQASALGREPADLALVYYNWGNALEGQGSLSSALDAFSQALEFDPHFVWALGNRGHVLSRLLRHVEAVHDYDRAYQYDPDDINAAWIVVWVHMEELARSAQREATAQELLRIARIEPEHAISPLCQGAAALLQSHAQEALTLFEKAEKQEFGEWEVRHDAPFWIGMALAYQGASEQAQEKIDQALHLGLPPIFLRPLRWVQGVHPSFTQYVIDLFHRYSVPDVL